MPRAAGTLYINPNGLKKLTRGELKRLETTLEKILFYPMTHRTRPGEMREPFNVARRNSLAALYYEVAGLTEDFDAV